MIQTRIKSGMYLSGTRWSVCIVDNDGLEYSIGIMLKSEDEAKCLADSLSRAYLCGKHNVSWRTPYNSPTGWEVGLDNETN